MFCPKCGKELPDEYKACPSCGFSFENFNTPKSESKEPDEKHIHVYNKNSGCLNDIVKVIVFLFLLAQFGGYLREHTTEEIHNDILFFVASIILIVVLYFLLSKPLDKLFDKYWPD